jgi:two-component system chemotaxis sensor kinase CheA
LAIIEGLLVRIETEHYVFPLSLVEECLEFRGRVNQHESLTIQNRGVMLPLLSLRNVLDVPGQEPAMQQVVVVNYQGRKLGMLVDTVIGDHQTVIKNLGKMYRGNIGMSGATILGDGRVALILDILGLVGFYEQRARKNSSKKAG